MKFTINVLCPFQFLAFVQNMRAATDWARTTASPTYMRAGVEASSFFFFLAPITRVNNTSRNYVSSLEDFGEIVVFSLPARRVSNLQTPWSGVSICRRTTACQICNTRAGDPFTNRYFMDFRLLAEALVVDKHHNEIVYYHRIMASHPSVPI